MKCVLQPYNCISNILEEFVFTRGVYHSKQEKSLFLFLVILQQPEKVKYRVK